MLKKLGVQSVIAKDGNAIKAATKMILPGVGAFDAGMTQLNSTGLKPYLDEAVLQKEVPVLGICLGMQLMTEGSEEGSLPGLGWIKAEVARFNPQESECLKVPHMGWNVVRREKDSPLLSLLNDRARFYFVHSYHVKCCERDDVLLAANHGSISFDAAFERENLLGVQFHPEKSHRYGMSLLKSFVEHY